MSNVLETTGLGKRYGRIWALQDCTLQIPEGRVVGLVGPNGAGKTTLLRLLSGLLKPTAGQISVMGVSPLQQPLQVLQTVGFLAQDRPLYPGFTVYEMLKLGRKLNRRWDDAFARQHLEEQRIPLSQKVSRLSGGQQAQVALTLALAKRPRLLLLDEPAANLDPLARKGFHQTLMSMVAQGDLTVLLSSHLIADLDRLCDYLIILSQSRVQVASDLEQLLARHKWITVPRAEVDSIKQHYTVLQESNLAHMSKLLVCLKDASPLHPQWIVQSVSLDYAYRTCASAAPPAQPNKFSAIVQCWHDHGFLYQTAYHPVTQFWLFQGIETAIFLALTALLLYVAIRLLKRRTY